ncbi:MAG TPA: hypothetical protein VJ991_14325 [Balneolales bacterium]|nr:hypothetical protein [Balneolales bacterium]
MDKNNTYFKKWFSILLLFTGFLITYGTARAQHSFNTSIDVYNQYVWRGFDFGHAPSLQPSFTYDNSNLEIGVWGAFATIGKPAYTETDAYVSYAVPIKTGSLSLGITDYFFPSSTPGKYFDYANAHVFEANVGYTGPRNFPIGLSANINFAGGDKQNSMYLQASYPILTAELTMGVIPFKSDYYGLTSPGVVLLGISNTQQVKITDDFSLPVHGAVQVNPYTKNIFLLFGITI